ncbi:MAG: CPBP family intramembrane glutamic endopeptidase [Candidatus Limnocylindrales bacterium]
MTATGLMLGGLALATNPSLRRTRIGAREVVAGLASAAALYGTFKIGDRFARRFVPGGDDQIRDIYSLRDLSPRQETAARLVTIIGPAEELFWRGLVQESLMRRYGRWTGATMAAVAYSAVHVTTGNFTLMGAAGVAGAHWSALYAAGVPIGALIVSHCAWDVWIFLVQPTGEVEFAAARARLRPGAGGAARKLGAEALAGQRPLSGSSAPEHGPIYRRCAPDEAAGGEHGGAPDRLGRAGAA